MTAAECLELLQRMADREAAVRSAGGSPATS